ncbi:hypothetical protein [Bdellovibrio bacteriovorus]|uniref:hypothetical protein n=1 Tax=Bdellovibrio TaxID=958 RepID=UPI0035A8450A
MTKRALLLQAIVMMFAVGTQAETMIFHGRVAARKQCADTGGVFATDLGCKKLALSQKECAVALNVSNGEVRSMQVEVPEAYSTGDARKAQYTVSVTKPYLYKDNFHAYMLKMDGDSSIEVKIASDGTGRVLAANMYYDHQFPQEGRRTYKQYECRSLKRVK